MRRAAILLTIALLAACGRRGTLTPLPGQSLPPKPATAVAAPTTEQMLRVPPTAAPVRVDDIIQRPERERQDDPFDLPPPRARP